MKAFWIFIISIFALGFIFSSYLAPTYLTNTVNMEHGGATYEIAFAVPKFAKWTPVVSEQKTNAISIEYQPTGSHVYSHTSTKNKPTLVFKKTNRQRALSVDELAKMNYFSSGGFRFSNPQVDKKNNSASILVRFDNIPGLYYLQAPINFTKNCHLTESKDVVVSVLESFSLLGKYRRKSSVEQWWRNKAVLKAVDWPSATVKCL